MFNLLVFLLFCVFRERASPGSPSTHDVQATRGDERAVMGLVLFFLLGSAWAVPFVATLRSESISPAGCEADTMFWLWLEKNADEDVRAVEVQAANGTFIHRSTGYTAPHIYRGRPANGTFLCDSFVTFSLSQRVPAHGDTDCTALSPDFSLGGPSVAGAWFCAAGSRHPQAAPARVLLMQVAVALGEGGSVMLRVYGKGARSCVATAVMEAGQTAAFECVAQPDVNVTLPQMPEPESNSGTVAGVVFGVLIGVALLVLLIVWQCRRRKARTMARVHLADRLCASEEDSGTSVSGEPAVAALAQAPPPTHPRKENRPSGGEVANASAAASGAGATMGARGTAHRAGAGGGGGQQYEAEDMDLLKYEDFL